MGALLQKVSGTRLWWYDICIALGVLGSAYLWLAEATSAHPANPLLPALPLLLFVVAAFIVGMMWWAIPRPRSNPPA